MTQQVKNNCIVKCIVENYLTTLTLLGIVTTMKNWTKAEIREFRTRLKLSQAKFGELVGTSGNYIFLLERGDRKPGKTLKILLNYIEKGLVGKGE